jgi:PIN domain nuclease of toxin-antitoxin system
MASYLLDTHTLIWYAGDDPRLPPSIAALIADPTARIVVSRVSLWEITIKESLGKLLLPLPYAQWMRSILDYDFQILGISDEHLQCLHGLPYHHRDPFDRLLIAQALTESLTLVSRDAKFASYSVAQTW